MRSKSYVLVSHGADADGVLSAALWMRENGWPWGDVQFLAAGLSVEDFMAPLLLVTRPQAGWVDVVVLDLGLTEAHVDALQAKFDRVIIVDHHPTTAELPYPKWSTGPLLGTAAWAESAVVIYDARKAACELVAEMCSYAAVFALHQLIERVGAHDTGRQLGSYKAAYVGALVRAVGPQAVLARLVDCRDLDTFATEALQFEVSNRMAQQIACARALSIGFTKTDAWDGRFFLAPVGSGDAVSVLGKDLLEAMPEVGYVILIDRNTGGLSFRSRPGGVDVSEIAKMFGGGGHPAASGARVDPEEMTDHIMTVLSDGAERVAVEAGWSVKDIQRIAKEQLPGDRELSLEEVGQFLAWAQEGTRSLFMAVSEAGYSEIVGYLQEWDDKKGA